MTAQQCAERQAARDNLVRELVETLAELRSSVNYRTAVLVSGERSQIQFADERMWKAMDKAGDMLTRAKEQA